MALTVPSIPSGSICKFQQTTAPTLWTKLTSYNDYALRVTSGTVSTGGTRAFSTVFTNQSPTSGGTLGSVSFTVAAGFAGAVSHTHSYNDAVVQAPSATSYKVDPLGAVVPTATLIGAAGTNSGVTSSSAGLGGSHTHTVSVPATYASPSPLSATADFSIQYVDMILAQRK